jgi:hypothetical protein
MGIAKGKESVGFVPLSPLDVSPSALRHSVDVSATNGCAWLYRGGRAFALGRFRRGEPGVDIDEAAQAGVTFEQVTPNAGPFSRV